MDTGVQRATPNVRRSSFQASSSQRGFSQGFVCDMIRIGFPSTAMYRTSPNINSDCPRHSHLPPMPLLSLPFFDHLFQTLSAFDVALLTLTTSFVSQLYFHTSRSRLVLQVSSLCFRHFEPRSNLPLFILLILVPSFLFIPISYHVRYAFAAVPLAFASYIGSLLFFTIAYRLSPFHPLAKYPGQTIAKTSKWWAAYAGGRGDLHLYYKRLHDHYGDVVRVGQHAPVVAFSDAPSYNILLCRP